MSDPTAGPPVPVGRTGTDDPFDTAAIRSRVLEAWAASPARFREDANTEEDFALGGYRDRLVVELAQNAADAATRAGIPGRLRLTVQETPSGPVLIAANTGSPLTAEGVEALATLRASAKRDASTVGRFGVGFAAVLAVTDDPAVLSRTGGVRFSREDTAELVAEVAAVRPALADEVRRRGGHVPVLRLPFDAAGAPPRGFDTAVVLPLRDEAAADLVRRLLAEVDDALLLALPGLGRVEIEVEGVERVLTDVESRWRVHRTGGHWSDTERERLLADRPTEERHRPVWSVLWALPRDLLGGASTAGAVLHAPTPTDEPLSLPALLIGSFPLDPTRRHVAPGPLTDRLVVEAARAYAELLRSSAEDGVDVLPFVPTGLASGGLDAALRTAILERLRDVPLLRSVEDGSPIRPSQAVVVDGLEGRAAELLAPVVTGLVTAHRYDRPALDALGVRRVPLADLVDELATVAGTRPPQWWRAVYDAFGDDLGDPATRDALGSLPVPLADGRTVRGPRGVLLPDDEIDEQTLATLGPYGLRIVHPEAVSHTLERLGAVPARARALLDDGAVRAAVEDSADVDDPTPIADAVLALVAASAGEVRPGTLPWLGDLALPDDTGEMAPAAALVLPGSVAEQVLDDEEFAPVAPELVARWGPEVLEAVGVVRTLGVVIANDVDLDVLPDEIDRLPDIDRWLDDLEEGYLGEFLAIRDLDCVRPTAWSEALGLIASDPVLRRALLARPSYTAWWIRDRLGLDGHADPEAEPVVRALLPAAPEEVAGLDPTVRRALGTVRDLDEVSVAELAVVLERLADPDVELSAAELSMIWARLGGLELPAELPEPPEVVRVLDGLSTRLVPAKDAVVVDAPMWLQRTDLLDRDHGDSPGEAAPGFVLGTPETAETLGELLDAPLASEVADGRVTEGTATDRSDRTVAGGTATPVPPVVGLVLPGAPETWWEHDDLRVDEEPVDWWVDDAGRVHAATTDGLARGLAWATGGGRTWPRRELIAAVLAEPERAADIVAECAFEA